MTILHLVTILCIGLMTGTEFAVSAFVNPVLWKLEDGPQVHAIRLFAAKLGVVMPFWYGLGLVFLLVETFMARNQTSMVLPAIASGIWALVMALTVIFLVPTNNKLARTETSTPVTLVQRNHRKWDALHRVRVLALIASMVIFLASIR